MVSTQDRWAAAQHAGSFAPQLPDQAPLRTGLDSDNHKNILLTDTRSFYNRTCEGKVDVL